MKLLVIGHSLIIDSNRKFWDVFAQKNNASVDLVAPLTWSSNLKSHIESVFNPATDSTLRKLILLPTFFKGNGSLFFFSPWGMFRTLNAERYDTIFLNQETWAMSTFWIIFLKIFSINREAKIFLCVAQNLKKENLKVLHPYERLISHFVYAFLYCSEEVKEVLRWKGIKNPCVYFPLPYDDQNYQRTLSSPYKDEFVLGYLGRLSEDKGIPVLIEACEKLKSKNINFKLLIGGNGPLVDFIKSKSYVEYLGLIPHNQAHKFYERIDCFILPSQTKRNWKEQFGRVIVESFGAGKPVIGSSSGSIPEVLAKLNWPWIFREDSSEELAVMIIKIMAELKTEEGIKNLKASVELNYQRFSQTSVACELLSSFQNT